MTIDIEIGRSNSYTYYASGLVETHTDERGLTTTNTWDNLQRVTGVVYPDGTTISNVYTALDLTGVKDRLNNWTTYAYNAIRQRISATDANGVVTAYDYCECGALEAVTNAVGLPEQMVRTFDYDKQGNRLHIYLPDETITNYFDPLGRVIATCDGWGCRWFGYNNQGLLFAITNSAGLEQYTVFDDEDRPIYVTDANGVTMTNAYDVLSRLTSREYPDGGMELFGYTPRGLVAYTNQLEYVTLFDYDEGGRKTVETNADNQIILYTNNAAGDLLSLTDGKGQTTRWGYSFYGLVTNKLDQSGTEILRYAWDADSRLSTRWSAAKGTTTYLWDNVGSLTEIEYPSTHPVQFHWDALRRMTNMFDGAGTTVFSYTSGGFLYTEDGPFASDTVTNIYSNRQRVGLGLQQPTGYWGNTFSLDAAKRLTAVISPAGEFDYEYPAGSATRLVEKLDLPNSSYITNVYDMNARLLSTALDTSTGTPLDSASYGYNVGNERTNFLNASGTNVLYDYDQIGQLTNAASSISAENRAYDYDDAWNVTNVIKNGTPTAFKVNGLNELTNIAATNFSSDLNGNLIYRTTLAGTVTNTFDDENRLIAVSWKSGNTLYMTTFVIDGLSRMREQLQWTNSAFTEGGGGGGGDDGVFIPQLGGGGGSNTWTLVGGTLYIYDGSRVIQERDINNNPTVSYTRGIDLSSTLEGAGGIGGLLARSDGYTSGTFTNHVFYHADGNGNITYLETTSQSEAASYRYDPFGNLLASSGPLAASNTYRFSSKEYIPSVELYYYLYRFYDSGLHRWLNQDPTAENGGINLYNFVVNDPADCVDVFGLDTIVVGGRATAYKPTGNPTGYGHLYDGTGLTAAMQPVLAGDGTSVDVTYEDPDGKKHTICVKVNDKGPYDADKNGHAKHPLRPHPRNVIDLSPTAMKKLTGKSINDVPVTIVIHDGPPTVTINWPAANAPAKP